MAVLNPFDFFLEPSAEISVCLRPGAGSRTGAVPAQMLAHAELHAVSDGIAPRPDWRSQLAPSSGWKCRSEKQPTNDFIGRHQPALWKDIKYTIRLEPGVQTPEETLAKMSGSCRDSAWLLVQLCATSASPRGSSAATLIQLKPDQKSLDGPSGAEKDFTDLHAWCEVYLPGRRLDRA
jgi:hypothetical protein